MFSKSSIFLAIIMSFFVSTNLLANDAPIHPERHAEKLWAILHQTHDRLEQLMQVNANRDQINKILTQSCDAPDPSHQLVRALHAEAKDKESNHGFSVRGAYTSESLNNTDGDGNAYLELSWDLLRQGYQGNKQQAGRLYRQAEIEALRGRIDNFDHTYKCRRYQFHEIFAGMQTSLQILKLELMEPVYQIEKRAYFKGWSYLDEYFISEQDIRLARDELRKLSQVSYSNRELLGTINPAVIDVDISAVITAISEDDRSEKLAQLNRQLLQDNYQNRQDDRLRLFLRKEFDVEGGGDQEGVVAGVRFTIPLEKKSNKSLSYRLMQVEEEAELQEWERITRARAAYEELKEQKSRVVKQQYRYLRSKERVRRVFVRKGLNQDLELAAAVARVRNLFDASIELIKAKEELFRRVNEIFLVSRVEYQADFINIESSQENNYRARHGERSIYIWSKTFNMISNQQLLDFFKTKSISRVLLSAGKATDRIKMSDFLNLATADNVQVETIIGSNNWFKPEHHQRASIIAMTKAEITGSIHLDIEPHTLPGYKQNKKEYLDQYLIMLGKLRNRLNDTQLSVAVPMHWPAEVYRSINSLVDRVYLMAYENKNTEMLVRKVAKVQQHFDRDKVVVVLSIKDFEDEWAMEKTLSILQREAGVSQFGFHQLRTFMQQAGVDR